MGDVFVYPIISGCYACRTHSTLSQSPMSWSFSPFFNQRLRQRHGCQLLIPKETDPCRSLLRNICGRWFTFILKNTIPLNIYCKCLKKMILPAVPSHRKTESKRAASQRPPTAEGLNSSCMSIKTCKPRRLRSHPNKNPEIGDLVGIDGSLIDATLSMHWADYREKSKKAKVHVGFDLNRAIPRKIYLTNGNGAERPFINLILSEGQTGVMDRGYQSHKRFDQWQQDEKLFMCRIKASTKKTIIKQNPIDPDSIVFFDAIVVLCTTEINKTQRQLRLVGYEVDRVKYWIATNRYDLTAEQIATAYKLRWDIENFFAWWKRHLKVYHLIARSENGLIVQILSGLITYLLLAIYCHRQFNERVSIKRVRQLRIKIQNELRAGVFCKPPDSNLKELEIQSVNAST